MPTLHAAGANRRQKKSAAAAVQKQGHSRSRHGKRSPAAMPPVKRRVKRHRQSCRADGSAPKGRIPAVLPSHAVSRLCTSPPAYPQTPVCGTDKAMLAFDASPPYFSPRPRVCLFRLICMYGFTELVRQKPPPVILRFFPYVSPAPPSPSAAHVGVHGNFRLHNLMASAAFVLPGVPLRHT